MNIFISWSGNRSKLVAELLSNWLQCVIQAAKPWVSTQDIEGGTIWFNEISNQLANTTTGLVCLTKENRNKPWILFESGALTKGLTSSRVYTFLIDLAPSDLENPLAQFNHTLPTKEGVRKLIRNINASLLENALKESILNAVFDTYWEQFEKKFNEIIADTPDENVEIHRSSDDIMNEVLMTVRNLDKRIRKVEREENRIEHNLPKTITLNTEDVFKVHESVNDALEKVNTKKGKYYYSLQELMEKMEKRENES